MLFRSIAFCNQAMVDLTGYPRGEIEGRNCRFLQGKRTEAAAVRAMVAGIRGAKPTTVRVTNYRKDGSMFTNMLTLSPIMDSSGAYRYNVGILADAANGKSESAGLEKLRGALPKTMPAQAQPDKFDEGLKVVDAEAQRKQYKASMVKFTRLLWSMEWDTSLKQLLMQPVGLQSFGQWLQKEAPSDAMLLELVALTMQLSRMPGEQAGPQAMQMCKKYLGTAPASPEAAVGALQQQTTSAVNALAAESFPKFVQSKACLPQIGRAHV